MARAENKDLFIKGENIILRSIKALDVNRRYLKWMQDLDVNEFLESRFTKWDMKKLKDYFKKNKHSLDYIHLVIILKENLEHIGNVKIGPINRIHKFADIGIIIGEKRYWGRGLATEAVKLTVNYCFKKLRLQKLTAGVYRDNIGSIRIFEKCGFKIEGVREKQYYYKGEYTNGILLGMVRR